MASDPGPAHYLTLAEARRLTCNGCGDCCDSRRTDGYWTWGSLPPDQFASLTGGTSLIIPLTQRAGRWCDRLAEPEDQHELWPTRFRCAAFRPQSDTSGRCARHDQPRPIRCTDFPVGRPGIERELYLSGETWLQTDAFPRCTWHRICIVREGDPRLAPPVRAGAPAPKEICDADL